MKLRTVLAAHPEWDALDDQATALALNVEDQVVVVPTFVSERTLMGEFGLAVTESFMAKLEGDPTMDRAVRWLKTDGIDFGNSHTRDKVDGLVATGTLNTQEGNALKGLAERTQSIAQIEGLGKVYSRDVKKARAV